MQITVRWLDPGCYDLASFMSGGRYSPEALERATAERGVAALGAYGRDGGLLGWLLYHPEGKKNGPNGLVVDAVCTLDETRSHEVTKSMLDRLLAWLGRGSLDLQFVEICVDEYDLDRQLFLKGQGFRCIFQDKYPKGTEKAGQDWYKFIRTSFDV